MRYGREKLGAKEGFFAGLVDVVVTHFGGFFPELVKQRDIIYSVLREEEAAFSRTLVKGKWLRVAMVTCTMASWETGAEA